MDEKFKFILNSKYQRGPVFRTEKIKISEMLRNQVVRFLIHSYLHFNSFKIKLDQLIIIDRAFRIVIISCNCIDVQSG